MTSEYIKTVHIESKLQRGEETKMSCEIMRDGWKEDAICGYMREYHIPYCLSFICFSSFDNQITLGGLYAYCILYAQGIKT